MCVYINLHTHIFKYTLPLNLKNELIYVFIYMKILYEGLENLTIKNPLNCIA